MGRFVAGAKQCFSEDAHTVDGFKKKFSVVHQTRMPTGDPLIADEVRRSKKLRYRMTRRADMGILMILWKILKLWELLLTRL